MPKNTARQRSYRQMDEDLSKLMAWFESEDVDLDEALVKYEQAAKLIDQMEKYLKVAKIKITKITKS